MAQPPPSSAASQASLGPSSPPTVGPSRRIRPGRRLLAIAAVVIVVVLVGVGGYRWLSAPSQTVWQAITSGIRDGVVPRETALQAFAYVYQVDMPGVTLPTGNEGGDSPTSGTGALRWVRAHWDELTADQQEVIDRYTGPDPADEVVPVDPSSSTAATAGLALAATRLVAPFRTRPPAAAPTTVADLLARELAADIARIGPRLGMPVISSGSNLDPNITLTVSGRVSGTALLTTQPAVRFGHYTPCHVIAYKNGWQDAVTTSGGLTPEMHAWMTHEAVHCYQNVVWGDVPTGLAMPAWILEGTAIYLAASDTGLVEPYIPPMWEKQYFVPETPLTNRSYDAFGFYALLAHKGRDLWALMLPAWQAAAKANSRSNAFIGVLDGDASDIRDGWAASYLREDAWGDPWIAYGIGLPPTARVFRHPVQAQLPPGWNGSLSGRSNTVLSVEATQGEVVTVATDGLASVHDKEGHGAVAFQERRFCTAEAGCVCPAGTLFAGQDMADQKMKIPFVVALNAPLGGSSYTIAAEKLDDLCQRQATPRPSPRTPRPAYKCGQNCSRSNGDPHLRTVDGFEYDFQARGEFTLLRSPDGEVDVQVRQEPFGTSGAISINTALATMAGGHRVGVYLDQDGLVARLDGAPLDVSAGPRDLGGGARVAADEMGFEIDFADGTRLWAMAVGLHGINIEISPSDALVRGGQGLLGTVGLTGFRIPALPDGTRLPDPPDRRARHDALYRVFADAWRVTDADSLFDYDPGASTASYAVSDYPTEANDISVEDLTPDQKAAGDATCGAITDESLNRECVFDVGLTGDGEFADAYAAIQVTGESDAAGPTPPPESFTPVTPPPGLTEGAWQVAAGVGVPGLAIGTGGRVYVEVDSADDTYSLLALDPMTSTIVRQVPVALGSQIHVAAGSLWLSGLGTGAGGAGCGVTRLDAETLVQQATIPAPCVYGLPSEIASDGEAAWFIDVSRYDPASSAPGQGTVITRIDPVTNAPGVSVALPFRNGLLADSQGALFYTDSAGGAGTFRLTAGSTAFEAVGEVGDQTWPAGTGLWAVGTDRASALYFTSAGAPEATVRIEGSVVAADTDALYCEVDGLDDQGASSVEVWRYPVDGSAPRPIASAPTIDGQPLGYIGGVAAMSDGNGFVKVWVENGGDAEGSRVLVQWTPVR